MGDNLLDRPIWNTLRTGWAHLAEGDARAWRLSRDYGMFAAPTDHSADSLAALAALAPDDGSPLIVVDDLACPAPPGMRRVADPEAVVQMVCEAPSAAVAPDFEILSLTEEDAAEMYHLAMLTRPGPYVRHTNRLGDFVGVRVGGVLVAMTGERMRLSGLAEVSGVCTHPDHRGKGYAAALTQAVVRRMLAKGETPFLHAMADNVGAIAVYERLGFRHRATMMGVALVRD